MAQIEEPNTMQMPSWMLRHVNEQKTEIEISKYSLQVLYDIEVEYHFISAAIDVVKENCAVKLLLHKNGFNILTISRLGKNLTILKMFLSIIELSKYYEINM